MFRALIIDDEKNGINSLRLVIEKFIENVKVVAETTDALEGIELIEDYKPDIVFLDVQMPKYNGFEVLEKLKYRGFHLIFTTAYEEYAVKAMRENAVDYLLKPIDADDLKEAIEKVERKVREKEQPLNIGELLERISMLNQRKIPFNTKERLEFIDKEDILRLESDSNYTLVYTTNGDKIMVSKNIGEYETMLCTKEHRFMRVHQSHIVNLIHVKRYIPENGGQLILEGDVELPISKNKKDEFLNWLGLR